MYKTGWTKVKLGDIATFTKGKNPKTYSDAGVGNPIVGAHEIECNTSEYEKYTCEELPKCIGTDVLILWDGSKAGKCGYGHSATLSSTIMKLTVKNTSIISSDYLYRAVESIRKDIESTKHGAAIPHLDRKAIEQIEIDLPPMEIQLQIAKLLTTIDNIIQSKSDESTKYQNMKTQLMNDIFVNGEREQKWTKVKIGDICEKIESGNRLPKSSLIYGDVPYIMAKTSNNGIEAYISSNSLDYNGNPMKLFSGNCITFSIDNPEAIFYQSRPFFTSNIMRVIHIDNWNKEHYLFILEQLKAFAKGYDWQRKFSGPVVSNLELKFPIKNGSIDYDTVFSIGSLLSKLDDIIQSKSDESTKYQNMKTQLMNNIFAE